MSDNYHGRYKLLNKNGTFIKWIPCPKCYKGSGVTKPCGTDLNLGANFQCLPCVRGETFSPGYNNKQCQKCKSCHEHELVVGHCGRVEDTRTCSGTCRKGFVWRKNATEPCQLLNSSIALDIKMTTNTSTTAMTTGGQTSTLAMGSIIGIVFGTVTALVCLILFLIWCYKKYKSYLKYRCCHDDMSTNQNTCTGIITVQDSVNAENIVSIDLSAQENNNDQGRSTQTLDVAHQSGSFDGSSETQNLLNSDATASLGTPGATPSPMRKDTECKVKLHKIYKMTPGIFHKFGQVMDKDLLLGNNRDILGGHLGYDSNDMGIFKSVEYPTRAMLDDWGRKSSQNTVLELAMIVKRKMERVDALELLEEELNLKRLLCKCGDSCPQITSSMEEPASL